jgi:4-amino-4-deoxy-L-arabinose transferase-like glycosyltransferase
VSRRSAVIALATILAIALVLRVVIAYAMPSQCWPDEIFQSLEQAHRVVFGRGVIPWEFVEGTRSWVFPGVLAGVMKLTSLVSSSPGAYLLACATLLSVVSLAVVWVAFRWGEQLFGLRGAVVAAGTCTLWYELVYFAPKAMSEVVAGSVLAAGVLLADRAARTPGRRDVLAGALLLALSALLRIQLAPAAGICFLYMLRRAPWRLRGEALGVAVAVALVFGIVDWATWGYPFASYVGNIRANLIEGRSRAFGVAPWYAYFQCYALLWGPAGLAILALAALGSRRAPLAGVTAVIVLLSHLPIAHKEYRFLFPALVLVIILAGLGLAEIVDYVARRRDARTANLAAAGVLVIALATSLTRANHFMDPGAVFLLGPTEHAVALELWSERRGYLLADRWISEQPDVCGVALAAVHWSQTGGYTYMHKDVPLVDAQSSAQLEQVTPYVNVLLARPDMQPQLGPFIRQACWNTACVYRRSGSCSPIDGLGRRALSDAYEAAEPAAARPASKK